MSKILYRLILLIVLLTAVPAEVSAQQPTQFQLDSAYLSRPFSKMDVTELTRMQKDADSYKEQPGFSAYKQRLDRVTDDLAVYDRAIRLLDSPFDFKRIVEMRKTLIPLISEEGYFTEAQQAEMDRLDILLSRYKNSVSLFQNIIGRINSDPVVIAYRAEVRKGRPSGDERREYIAAISAIVYKPSSKDFTDEISSYIQLIPYLKPRFTEYLNSVAQNPDAKPAVEAEIMDVKL